MADQKRSGAESPKRTRAKRILDRHFAGADIYDKKSKFFAPLPVVYRRLLHALKPREWMVLSWLLTNSRKEGVAEVVPNEIAKDIGLRHANRMWGHLKSLKAKGFIDLAEAGGRHYAAILHPRVAVKTLRTKGQLSDERLRSIRDHFEDTIGLDGLPETDKP